DRPDGDREHAHPGLVALRRDEDARRAHRRGDLRGAAGGNALPDAFPRGPPPLHPHVRRQHRRRADTAAPSEEVRGDLMSALPNPAPPAPRKTRKRSLLGSGLPFIWLTAGGLAISVAMIVGVLLLIFVRGAGTLWPKRLERLALADGSSLLVEVLQREGAPKAA